MTVSQAPPTWTPTNVPFIDERLAANDLVLCHILDQVGPQALRATVELARRVARRLPLSPGTTLDFVHAPGSWGFVPLQVGDRALVLLHLLRGVAYEAHHHGHWLVKSIAGEDLALLPLAPSHLAHSELAPLLRPVPGATGVAGLALDPLLARLGVR